LRKKNTHPHRNRPGSTPHSQSHDSTKTQTNPAPSPPRTPLVAAAGRVEASLRGRQGRGRNPQANFVRSSSTEGDHVRRGQVIAVLNNDGLPLPASSPRPCRGSKMRESRTAPRRQRLPASRNVVKRRPPSAKAEAVMANAPRPGKEERRESLFSRTGDISRSDFRTRRP